MSTFTANNVSSGATIYASDHNELGSRIAAVVNGGLDNNNIASGAAIDGSKLADDGVTDSKLDYPRWYQEIGRTTLGSAGDTLSVASLPTRKYLKILVHATATGGNVTLPLRFNNDTGNNYSATYSTWDGNANSTSTTSGPLGLFASVLNSGDSGLLEIDVVNIESSIKFARIKAVQGTTSVGSAPSVLDMWIKWVNTSAAINQISFVNGGTGDFATGTELIVLGHD